MVLLTISSFISYYLVSIYFIFLKSKFIIQNSFIKLFKVNINIFESNTQKHKSILTNLGNPYGLDIVKYKLFKLIISPLIFILVLYRSNNIFLSLLYFLCFFNFPNLIINIYTKNESIKIINDISEICNNLKLALSSNISLHESLNYVKNNIEYKRFRDAFDIFINDYIMYNFNMIKATDNFKLKFNSYEFNMFLSIILQGEKEGKMVEALNVFSETLDLSYFKYLKYKEARRIMFVTIASIISLFNITAIAVYPIIIQISQNLQNIFN